MQKSGTFLYYPIDIDANKFDKEKMKNLQDVPIGDCDYIMVCGYAEGKGFGSQGIVVFNFAISVNSETYDTAPIDYLRLPLNVKGMAQASKCIRVSGGSTIKLLSIDANESATNVNCGWGKRFRSE